MRIYIFALLTICLSSCILNKKQEKSSLAERISRIENGLQPKLQIKGLELPKYHLIGRMEELDIPGVSIAILVDGKIDWAKAYGFADKSEQRKNTTETLFLAGSVSKVFAATKALQLAEEGKINLDSNINNHLSSWQLPDNDFTAKQKVTSRRILNHSAGLTVWGFPGYNRKDSIPSLVEILDGKGNTDAIRVYKEPGESWMYSGGGYTILQLMMMDIAQQSFPEIMHTDILSPLGMKSSTFENPLPVNQHQLAATGYKVNGEAVDDKWRVYPEMAAAGLWTTPSELILWAKDIQTTLQRETDGLLKKGTVQEMLTPAQNNHGLGPVINEHTFGHSGADQGFRTEMLIWKESAHAVVIMLNSDNDQIIDEILLSIAQEYGLKGVEPISRVFNKQSDEELQKFSGKYSIPRLGDLQIEVKNNGLEIFAAFLGEPTLLLPESDLNFFAKNDGTYFKFLSEEGAITGFNVQGQQASKVE